MVYNYNKLVRDKIVENINADSNKRCSYEVLDEDTYKKELDKKLLEEANEFIENHEISEMGDLLEVINTIIEVYKIDKQELENVMFKKREKKGSFKKRIFLKQVEE